MKRKGEFSVRLIDNQIIAVALDESADSFHGMIKLNETGLLLWKLLLEDRTIEELIKAITDEYEIDEYTAAADVEAFIEKLRDANLMEE